MSLYDGAIDERSHARMRHARTSDDQQAPRHGSIFLFGNLAVVVFDDMRPMLVVVLDVPQDPHKFKRGKP